MATLENEKLLTAQFLENAINDGNANGFQEEEVKNESEKLILDEISNENPEKIDENQSNDVQDSLSESCPFKPTEIKEANVEDLTEETESSRDLKTVATKGPNEERSTDNETEAEKPSGDKPEPEDEWQDVLGSGVIMRKIVRQGEPNSRPQRANKCFINYTCRLEDADDESIADKGENYELGLGEGDVVQGLDVAIGLMNKNERCLLKIGSRLAFGAKGLAPNIPGEATVMYDIELLDVQNEDDCDGMRFQERRRLGNRKRERGNWWYQRGENTLAIQSYRRALDYLDEVENDEDNPSDSELQQLLEDRLKVLNNMASAQIKMDLYEQAQMSLTAVLKCQPDNVKALFRKSKVHIAKNDLKPALNLLEKAKSLEPDDPLIAKEIGLVNGLINKQKNSEREYARRMFGAAVENLSSSKTKVSADEKKSGGRYQVWATLGATLIIGIAGVVAYKLKYT